MGLSPGTRLGPFEVLAPIGAGGMGEVWRARDPRMGRDVAIKVLHSSQVPTEERLRRFEQEARAAGSLSHPNLVTIFELGTHEGAPYIAMELLEGATLREMLRGGAGAAGSPSGHRAALPVRKAIGLAAQIAHGLAAAHEKGLVHRDLKPENIFVTTDGQAKILDFGLVKLAPSFATTDTHQPTSPLTTEGVVVGTVGYMAPEQLREEPVDARTDIFSLGAVLYEMLSGNRAFHAATSVETMNAILNADPPPLDGDGQRIAPGVDRIVRRCLEKEPRERFQSARDLMFALQWLGEAASGAMSGSIAGSAPARPRTRALAAATLVSIAALGAGVWLGRVTLRPAVPAAKPIPKLVRLTFQEGSIGVPSISPDGASFVYQGGPPGRSDVFLQRIGGENPINLTKDYPGDDLSPAFSPDGRSIVFRSERDGGGIFVMGATGESPRRLTDFGYDPAWSPDGKAIALATAGSYGLGGRFFTSALWIVDVGTGARRKLFDGDALHPTWSPSGTRIAFHARSGGLLESHSLWTVPVAGGSPTPLLDLKTNLQSQPAWGRGGILFNSDAGGVANIWRVRVDEATGTRIGDPEPVVTATQGAVTPSMGVDGRRLLFTASRAVIGLDRYAFDAARGRVSSERHTILSVSRDIKIQTGSPSPDGEWLAMLAFDGAGSQDILLVRVRTGETRRLTDDPLREDFVEWAPDGSKLYFIVSPAGTSEVWSLRPDGSGRERVASSGGKEDLVGVLASPDGRSLYVEVGTEHRPHMIDLGVPFAERRLVALPPLATGKQFAALSWSPDGRWLAGYSFTRAEGFRLPLTLFDREAGTYQELADPKSLRDCAWLPDSRRILFWGGGRLELLDRVTRAVTPAGSLGENVGRVALSRDGRSLFSQSWTAREDIWMLDYGATSR